MAVGILVPGARRTTTSMPDQLAAAVAAARLPSASPRPSPSPKIVAMPASAMAIATSVRGATRSPRKTRDQMAANSGAAATMNSVLATLVVTIAVTNAIDDIENRTATPAAGRQSQGAGTRDPRWCRTAITAANAMAINRPRQNSIVQMSALTSVVSRPSGVSTRTPTVTIRKPREWPDATGAVWLGAGIGGSGPVGGEPAKNAAKYRV